MNRVEIETGISGHDQEHSFMNATLQMAGDWDFSIAMYVDVPETMRGDEDAVREFLSKLLTPIVAMNPEVSFRVEIGPRDPHKACFHPQAWQDDDAIEVDPQGPTEWRITPSFLATLSNPESALEGYNYDADQLRHDPAAPEWVREWSGPFEIEVNEDDD